MLEGLTCIASEVRKEKTSPATKSEASFMLPFLPPDLDFAREMAKERTVSIFSNLNHPCSFVVCYYLFGVFPPCVKHYFQVSFNLKVNLSMVKIPQNIVREPLQ